MPPIPEKEDHKEVRLFGERSIKEEAYRQKIIQLEIEIMQLESVLKNQDKEENVSVAPAQVEHDEKIKKYENILEAKAKNLSEMLNAQTQNLIKQERLHSRLITTKKTLIVLSIFVAIAIIMSAISIFTILKLNGVVYNKDLNIPFFYENTDNVKGILEKSGFYKNQYTIISLNYYNQIYKGAVELHFNPHDKWALKMIASDIIENFKTITIGKSIELNFLYEGNTYLKADFSPVSGETHYEFK